MEQDIQYNGVWKSNPEIIKQFLEQRLDYEHLCAEIAYILGKRLNKKAIEISSVSNRAKTLKSFLEKVTRKNYQKPFEEITDFAGVRIVYLYQQDLEQIENIITEEFSVIEKVDKLNDKGIDRFGYGALHFIVQLGKNSSGARYDDLKSLKCEIQVRTVLQDAWAIIDHHLVYKREADIPSNLQRKLNSLAGLFEIADNQYDNIRNEREKYLKKLDKSLNSDIFLQNEINLDSFEKYLKWKFPELKTAANGAQVEVVYGYISALNYLKLQDIDLQINTLIKKRNKIASDFYQEYKRKITAVIMVHYILAMVDSRYLDMLKDEEAKKYYLTFKENIDK